MQAESQCEAAVLTPPLSLEGGLAAELRPANLVQRVLSLFRNVRPGSDLSHFQVRACVMMEHPKQIGITLGVLTVHQRVLTDSQV